MTSNILKGYIEMNNPQIMAAAEKAHERFHVIVNQIGNDDITITLIEKVVESAERYFSAVCNMESQIPMLRLRYEGDDFRARVENLDKNRKYAHDSLISSLQSTTRHLRQEHNIEASDGLYVGDPWHLAKGEENRVAIADWAGALLYGLYINRKR